MEKERKEVRIEDAMAEKEALDKKAQEILEEKDADSRLRVYKGPLGKAIIVLLCVWTAFQLYFTTIGAISAVNLRAIHTIFLLVFTFLLFPTFKSETRKRKIPPIWDIAFILGSVGSFGYLILNFTRIAQTGGRINNMEIGIALVGIVCVFEAARRASGNLAILAALFLAYNWFGAYLPGYLGHNGFTPEACPHHPVLGYRGRPWHRRRRFCDVYFSLRCLWRFPEAQRIFQIHQ